MRISFVLKHALGLSLQCIQRVKITWPHLSEIHAIELCVPLSGSGTHNIYDSMFPVLLHILSHIRPFCLLVRLLSQSVNQSVCHIFRLGIMYPTQSGRCEAAVKEDD